VKPARPVVAAAIAATGFVAGLFRIFDGDIFWHLASGRWIVAHGAVPRVDPFRFSAAGLPWVDHEWLFQLAAYGIERIVGLDGLIVARALALAVLALLLFRLAQRPGLPAGLAALVTLGAVLGVRPRFLDRPEISTLFAIVALLSMLERAEAARREEGASGVGRRWLGLLVLLTVIWVNLHGEALLAPTLAGLFLLGAALDARAGGEPIAGRWRAIFGIPALLTLALLVNPYGWRLLDVPLGIRRALSGLAAANPEWLSALAAPQPFLFGGLAATLVVGWAARRERGQWVALSWALPTAAMAVVALTAVRHQALFYVVAAPFVARCLAGLRAAREVSPRADRGLAATAGAMMLFAAIWCIAPPDRGPLRPRHGGLEFGLGVAHGQFPVRMTAALAARPEIGPLYNEFAHGGYLLWHLFPPRRVFLDGRMELEPALLHELAAARRSPVAWRDELVGRGAVGALVRYETRQVPILEPDPSGALRVVETRTANSYLFDRELWQLADWDDESMLFLLPGTAGWSGEPYRFVDPEDVERTLRVAAADPEFRRSVIGELERKLTAEPGCRRAGALLRRLQASGGTD